MFILVVVDVYFSKILQASHDVTKKLFKNTVFALKKTEIIVI